MQGWLSASLKSTETRDELSTTCNPKVMSRCLSVPDATSSPAAEERNPALLDKVFFFTDYFSLGYVQ